MAGGKGKYRHLSRDSAHRKALLRNLVTSLFENESITTTWAKAKEAQRLADKLITLGKKNTEASRRKALEGFFKPHAIIPKLFGPLRERYANRPGGYTRVLRIEPKQNYEYYSVAKGDKHAEPERKPNDQAPSAILELVDGPKDMRFAITARALARAREHGWDLNDVTVRNAQKVTRFRQGGQAELEAAIRKLKVGEREAAAKELDEADKAMSALGQQKRSNPEEERAQALANKVNALKATKKGEGEGWESQVHDQKKRV